MTLLFTKHPCTIGLDVEPNGLAEGLQQPRGPKCSHRVFMYYMSMLVEKLQQCTIVIVIGLVHLMSTNIIPVKKAECYE